MAQWLLVTPRGPSQAAKCLLRVPLCLGVAVARMTLGCAD